MNDEILFLLIVDRKVYIDFWVSTNKDKYKDKI